jgi:glycosyltransferase involved in cell wall biosynthesis
MKILYLITKSEAGGAQTHVYELCKYFSKKNNIVVMSSPGGWLEKQCSDLGVEFIPNNYFSNKINFLNIFKAIKKIRGILIEEKPDIVHCHSSGAGFVGRLATKNKIPTFFTAHGWGFNIGVPFTQKCIAIFAEKYVSKYCEKIICVSQFVRDLGLKYKIAKKEKFEIIYNGVDVVEKKLYNLKNKKIKILFVGRLAEPKEPLILLKVYQKLSDEFKQNLEINIVGDGPKKKELSLFVKKNNLENVNLLGNLPRSSVFDIMTESNIFVLISKYEGLPMTILEAMSVGLPIIASDVGGVKEVVNKNNGFLLKNNSVQELKIVLDKLINNKKLREKMGETSKERVLEKFSLIEMLEKTDKVYEFYR